MIWLYTFGIAIATGITGVFYVRDRIKMCNIYVNVAIDQTMWLSALVAHAITCVEVCSTIPRQVVLIERIQNAMEEISKSLAIGMNLGLLRREMIVRSWASFLAIVFSIALSFMVMSESARLDFRWMSLSGTITQLRLLQVTIYVHIVNDFLGRVRLELVRIGSIPGTQKRCVALEECKLIYSKISDIVQLVNAVFGWSLIAILTQHTSAITNSLYWTVYNVYYMQRFKLNLCEFDADSRIWSICINV